MLNLIILVYNWFPQPYPTCRKHESLTYLQHMAAWFLTKTSLDLIILAYNWSTVPACRTYFILLTNIILGVPLAVHKWQLCTQVLRNLYFHKGQQCSICLVIFIDDFKNELYGGLLNINTDVLTQFDQLPHYLLNHSYILSESRDRM